MMDMRRIAAIAVVASSLAGCQWASARFDSAGSAANVFETTITRDNVAELQPEFVLSPVSTAYAAPVVAGGRLYTKAFVSDDALGWNLVAYDAAGRQGCDDGTPRRCDPIWVSQAANYFETAPVISGRFVYTESRDMVAAYAIDDESTAPVWTAPLERTRDSFGMEFGTIVVAGGRVFVGESSEDEWKVMAFDAAGIARCSGTPRVCAPLWTTTFSEFGGYSNPRITVTGTALLVSTDVGIARLSPQNGRVLGRNPDVRAELAIAGSEFFYIGTGFRTEAVDMDDSSLDPTWTGFGYPGALADGRLYTLDPLFKMSVFDAAGEERCEQVVVDAPKQCEALWTYAGNSGAPPTIAGDLIWAPVVPFPSWSEHWQISAWDARGQRSCRSVDTPYMQCDPLWTLDIPSDWSLIGSAPWSPITVLGRVYVPTARGELTAFSLPQSIPDSAIR